MKIVLIICYLIALPALAQPSLESIHTELKKMQLYMGFPPVDSRITFLTPFAAKGKKVEGIACDDELRNHIKQSFRKKFGVYFLHSCGLHSGKVYFRMNGDGFVTETVTDSLSADIMKFITGILITEKKKLPVLPAEDSNKVLILPLYVTFTDLCRGENRTGKGLNEPDMKSQQPVFRNCYTMQREPGDSILLWPLVLNGPFIFRTIFDPDRNRQ